MFPPCSLLRDATLAKKGMSDIGQLAERGLGLLGPKGVATASGSTYCTGSLLHAGPARQPVDKTKETPPSALARLCGRIHRAPSGWVKRGYWSSGSRDGCQTPEGEETGRLPPEVLGGTNGGGPARWWPSTLAKRTGQVLYLMQCAVAHSGDDTTGSEFLARTATASPLPFLSWRGLKRVRGGGGGDRFVVTGVPKP